MRSTAQLDAFVTDGVGLYTIDAQAVRACSADGPAAQACPELVTGEQVGNRLANDEADWDDWFGGGKGRKLAQMPAISPRAIALRSNRVVIADSTYKVLVVCPTKIPCTRINVGLVDTRDSDDDAPAFGRALTVTPSRLSWAQGDGIRTSSIPVPGFIVRRSAVRAAADTVDTARVLFASASASADEVFWLSGAGLHSATEVSATAQPERWSARAAADFAVDAGSAYLASSSGLFSVNRADRTETIAAAGAFARVVADERGVYATKTEGSRTTLVDVRSGKALALAVVEGAIDGLAVAGDHVYFMTRASGAAEILRVAR